jgi:hypothetical protein
MSMTDMISLFGAADPESRFVFFHPSLTLTVVTSLSHGIIYTDNTDTLSEGNGKRKFGTDHSASSALSGPFRSLR